MRIKETYGQVYVFNHGGTDTRVFPKEKVAVWDVLGLESNLESYQNGGFQNGVVGVFKNDLKMVFGQGLRHNL